MEKNNSEQKKKEQITEQRRITMASDLMSLKLSFNRLQGIVNDQGQDIKKILDKLDKIYNKVDMINFKMR